ncbi:MAG: DNA polymerase III subunit delta [Bacilli bacterium]|nr:DNA polymerase III subunit delta [Bacilli bacterium]
MKNIYLITSNSYRMLDDEVSKIVGSNSYSTFDLNYVSINDVIEEAAYFSLFDEKKFMVVRNSNVFGTSKAKKSMEDLLNKSEEELTSEELEKLNKYNNKDKVLLDYLEEPNPNTVLIFTMYGKADSKKKVTKLVKDRYELISIDDLKPKDLREKIEKDMKSDGFKVDYNVSSYILNSCQNNYDLVYNELEKIKLYYGKGCNVLLEDVMNIVSRNIEDSNFKFIDAVMNKDMVQSFKIYDDLMLQKVEPIMLLSMIAKEVRNTLLVKKMINKFNKKDIMSKLKINFDFQIDKIINNSYSFKESELEKYLVYLCDLDYKIKRGKVDKKLALELFILNLCK